MTDSIMIRALTMIAFALTPALAQAETLVGDVTLSTVWQLESDTDYRNGTITILPGGAVSFDNVSNVSFSNIGIVNTSGQPSLQGTDCSNVRIFDNRTTGDIFGNDTSGIFLRLESCRDVTVENNKIESNWGGIYVLDSEDTVISHNLLYDVAFGNIVVSGKNISITGNRLSRPGITTRVRGALGGDGITLWEFENVSVVGNEIVGGNCYGIWASRGGTRLAVTDNVIRHGLTWAVNLINVTDANVHGNLFEHNRGGLAASGSTVSAYNNDFNANPVAFTHGTVASYRRNRLYADYVGEDALRVRHGAMLEGGDNTTIYPPSDPPVWTTPPVVEFPVEPGEVFILPLKASDFGVSGPWRVDTAKASNPTVRTGAIVPGKISFNYGGQYMYGVLEVGSVHDINGIMVHRSGAERSFLFRLRATGS